LGSATDLYALGVVLYELLAGAPLFDPTLPTHALWQHHLHTIPAPPAGVPAPVAEVVLRALAKDPAARQPSAHAFALDLAAAAARAYGPDWADRSRIRLHLGDDVRKAASQSAGNTFPDPPTSPADDQSLNKQPSDEESEDKPVSGTVPGPVIPKNDRPSDEESEDKPVSGTVPGPVIPKNDRPSDEESEDKPAGNTFPDPPIIPKNARRARVAVAALLAAGAGAALAIIFASGGGPTPTSSRGTPVTVVDAKCPRVTIYDGLQGLAFQKYGEEMKRILEGSGPDSQRSIRFNKRVEVDLAHTDGTIDNIKMLAHAENRACGLALTQMNVAVDAASGFFEFRAEKFGAVPDLKSIGPIYHNAIHIIVLKDSKIREAADLCGKVVHSHGNSGARQLIVVLEKMLYDAGVRGCKIAISDVGDDLDELAASRVDAVFWATGEPNQKLQDRASALGVRLLPTAAFRQEFQADWNALYGTLPRIYPGDVFEEAAIKAGDYPGVGRTPTFAIPNGVVALAEADPGLVRVVTQALFTERAAFEQALWESPEDRKGRSFPGPELVSQNPLFCYVRPHDAAEGFYKDAAARDGYTYLEQCSN
jgi:TRAP transporter TAXI family solute receptor